MCLRCIQNNLITSLIIFLLLKTSLCLYIRASPFNLSLEIELHIHVFNPFMNYKKKKKNNNMIKYNKIM